MFEGEVLENFTGEVCISELFACEVAVRSLEPFVGAIRFPVDHKIVSKPSLSDILFESFELPTFKVVLRLLMEDVLLVPAGDFVYFYEAHRRGGDDPVTLRVVYPLTIPEVVRLLGDFRWAEIIHIL